MRPTAITPTTVLVGLLRAMAESKEAKERRHDVILEAAAGRLLELQTEVNEMKRLLQDNHIRYFGEVPL